MLSTLWPLWRKYVDTMFCLFSNSSMKIVCLLQWIYTLLRLSVLSFLVSWNLEFIQVQKKTNHYLLRWYIFFYWKCWLVDIYYELNDQVMLKNIYLVSYKCTSFTLNMGWCQCRGYLKVGGYIKVYLGHLWCNIVFFCLS